MNTVNVFEEILEWSIERPSWQRDALRRLVAKGDLDESRYWGISESLQI